MKSNDGRGVWKAYCVHMYSLPHTINNALVTKEEAQRCDNQRHKLSPGLVKRVKKSHSEPLWLTAGSSPKDMLISAAESFYSLKTGGAPPLRGGGISERFMKGSVVFVLYAFDELICNENAWKFLHHIGTAALVSIATSFPIEERHFDSSKVESILHGSGASDSQTSRSFSAELSDMQYDDDAIDLDMKFELLKDVGIFRSGSRCTMYEGRMEDLTDIFIKVVRKDARDKTLVKSELQLEINLLRQVHCLYFFS